MVGILGHPGGDLAGSQFQEEPGMSEQRKGRFMLILLVLVFALPVVAVVLLHMLDWRPAGQSYGELVQPPRTLQFAEMRTAANQPFGQQDWLRKWHLVYITKAECDTQCQKDLHTLRQLHASLAKEIDRVQRVWLISNTTSAAQLDALQRQYPDLVVLPQAAGLAAQFETQSDSRYVYLVDPMGHFMMRYPPDADPYGMRKDLLRLLTYSWAG
jgi:hypothetical protein